MNIGAIQQELMTALLTIYADGEAVTICDWVMEHFTGKPKMQRHIEKGVALPANTIQAINEAKEQLLQYKPVQYVLGEAWFMGLKFYVDENVLIPRPETEELIALVLANKEYILSQHPFPEVLDIGTGSGCIAITLKHFLPDTLITSIDISNGALEMALKNSISNKVYINFKHLDFLNESTWEPFHLFHAIVSNPPYIPLSEKAKLDKHVTAWEPGTALFVPDNDALIFYKKIAAFGKRFLHHGGRIFVEMHQDYAVATQQMFEENGYETELKKDINDNNRMLLAWKKTINGNQFQQWIL
jgi:release factor glutamine methyltransferase